MLTAMEWTTSPTSYSAMNDSEAVSHVCNAKQLTELHGGHLHSSSLPDADTEAAGGWRGDASVLCADESACDRP